MIKFGMPDQLFVAHRDRGNKVDLAPDKLLPVEGADWCKPTKGGLWTSTLIKGTWSDWCSWTKDERFMYVAGEEAFVLKVDHTAKIFEVNGINDALWLKKRYTPTTESVFKDSFFLRLDWPKIAEDFDGVHLTEEGNSVLHLPTMRGVDMNPWDAESTIWFRWKFTDMKKIRIKDPDEEEK